MFQSKVEQSPEISEKFESRVVIELMRHGEKEKLAPGVKKEDTEVRLSAKGRSDATDRGKEIHPNPAVAFGAGSPKKRAQETALLVLMAEEGRLDPNATLEENMEELSKIQKYGKKVIELPELDFNSSGAVGAGAIKAYGEKRLLPFYIYDSDKIALDAKDKNSSTATRFAGNIAKLVKHYSTVGNNFNRIAGSSGQYQEMGNRLERYFGTHQSVAECFLARVLEKTEGPEARDEFVKSLGGGFGELAGIRIEIVNGGNGQKIMIAYNGDGGEKKIEIPNELIDELLKERDDFEKIINAVA